LSLAAYSFRDFFIDTSKARPQEPAAGKRLDLFGFLDFCAEHGCHGAELTSYYFPPDFTEEFLLKLRRHAFLRGLSVSGTAVGNTFTLPAGPKRDQQITMVKTWVDHTSALGASHLRIFAGGAEGVSAAEAKKLCLAAVEECAEYAGKRGVFLGLENHGGIVAEPDDLLEIVRAVKSPWVGINLDTANFHTDDPYRDITRCAPYSVNVQLKADMRRRGQRTEEPADLERLLKILREANYQGWVALEYESKEDPWKAVPGLLKRLREIIG
jgi:sugar phosphate isomerase/epimerase